MEKNEQETPRTFFSFNLILTKSWLKLYLLVDSICENYEDECKTIKQNNNKDVSYGSQEMTNPTDSARSRTLTTQINFSQFLYFIIFFHVCIFIESVKYLLLSNIPVQ